MLPPYHQLERPAYVLDLDRLRSNLKLIDSVQQQTGAHVLLALKGFSMWSVFPLIKSFLKGATASSYNEARLIFDEMGCKAHTYSPGYIKEQFEAITNYSSHITFNSINEFEKYYRSDIDVSFGIRVNPEFSDVATDLYNPGNPDSRLGVLKMHFPQQLPKGISGLHMHTLCESGSEGLQLLIQNFEEKFEKYIPNLKWVNFGGGHLMTRKNYNLPLLINVLHRFKNKYPHLEIYLEPGSAIVWDTGELVASVLDIVKGNSIDTAILDVSFTAHMPDTLEMPYRPFIEGASDPVKGKPTYRLGGNSCLAGDFMHPYSFERPLNIGDKIIFKDMIHYTMVKTTMFNGVDHPDIITWSEQEQFKLIRRFSFDDFKSRLS
jgi:carboxynorspermidine decarboxylase